MTPHPGERLRLCILLLALVAALPQAARAQVSADYLFRPGVVTLSLFGGGIAFSDFRREAAPIDAEQRMEQRLSASTSVLAAGAVTYWFGRRWGVRVHASYAPSRLEVRMPETYSAREELREQNEPALSRLDVWMYDADVLFHIPLPIGRLEPYGIAGAGAVEYRLRTAHDEMVPEPVSLAFERGRQRRFAGVLGVGAVVPLERYRLLLNFELTNHITRTPLYEEALPELAAADPESEQRVDEVGYTSNARLIIGLTMPLFNR